MSRSAHQDWFMMTGDLIINLTNNKSTDLYNKKNFKFKTAPNLMSSSRDKQSNSEPNSPLNSCLNQTIINHFNDQNNGSFESNSRLTQHKETQTNNNVCLGSDKSDRSDRINESVVRRQMSLPLVRFSKSDDQLLAGEDLAVVADVNCSGDCSTGSLNTLLSEQQLQQQNQLSNVDMYSSPDNDHEFNDDDEELLTTPQSYSLSDNSLKSDSNNSQSITISSANLSPTKTMTTVNTIEQTESSMSENYSIVSSISCQTIDQNRRKSSFKAHNNQTLSLSSSISEDSTTPSSSPEDQLLRPNLEDDSTLEDVSYLELNGDHGVGQSEDKNVRQAKTTIQDNNKETAQKGDVNSDRLTTQPQRQQSVSSSDEESSDVESLHSFHYSPPKAVDTPSASRLAKRLFNLEGFKKSDVSRHLSKNNEFSRVVAEEYLRYFDFTGDTLDLALRKFLLKFCLIGETQERERVLVHFSKRFLDCNPNASFKSNDAIHTLTCALMLLNTDLHGQNVGRKMTCNEFIQNLSEMNDGEDFPSDILRQLYQGIKQSPLEWNADGEDFTNEADANRSDNSINATNLSQQISMIGHNPFLEVPNPNCATEYKKGYIMRKSCYESSSKKTPIGKRGWKMFYATLRDLVLYLHKDEQGFRKNQLYESLSNSIRVHHALASNASDYTKKQFVFRLITADHAEYLFQTSDSRELQSWVDTINTVSASLSSPPLPVAVGSNTKKFQRPLLPVSHTKLNLRDQLNDQENRVIRLQNELEDHLAKAPERGSSKRLMQEFAEKESFLQHELKRYRSYVLALKWKLSQYNTINNINTPPVITSASSSPLLTVAIGEETSDDSSDTPVIIPVKRNYSADR